MRVRVNTPILLALAVGLAACAREGQEEAGMQQEAAAEMGTMSRGQMYPNLVAPVLFENERVVVQRPPGELGQWSGEHSHAGNQLAIVLAGGTLTFREGGEETERTSEAGDVIWVEATEAHDHAITAGPADEILITLVGTEMMGGMAQAYPDMPADIVFENDHVVVQTLRSELSEWAGEHSHAGNQLAVALTGGTIMYREGGEETPRTFEKGEVWWIEATEAHDHTGSGDAAAPWRRLLVTFK